MAEQSLFSEFEARSKADWMAQIEADLKGKKPSELHKQWQDLEVDPFKSKTDLSKNTSCFRERKEWFIAQAFCVDTPKETNARILEALMEGVNSIEIAGLNSKEELEATLESVNPEYIQTNFKLGEWMFSGGLEAAENWAKHAAGGSWGFDPLGKLYRTKSWYRNQEEDIKLIEKLSKSSLEQLNWLEINGADFHNEGAYASTELALSLAMFNEYLAVLADPAKDAGKLEFKAGVGVLYFIELTKLRSLRTLAGAVAAEYGYSGDLFISANTGIWGMSAYDRHNNLLRSSTQIMAAAIGGADAISATPFDLSLETDHRFARHLSRMQHQMLIEESFLDRVIDPMAGSYFLESLQADLEQKAWAKFQTIEKEGGFIQALASGLVSEMVHEDRQKQFKELESGELSVLGVNLYPNKEEQLSAEIREDLNRLSSETEKGRANG